MFFASAVVKPQPKENLVAALVGPLREQLAGRSADLCMLLAAGDLGVSLSDVALGIQDGLHPRCMIGTTGEGVINGPQELEGEAALAVWVAHLPGVHLQSFHLMHDDVMRLDSGAAVEEQLGVPSADNPFFLLMGDPFSINVLEVLDRLERAYPGRPACGGMASAGQGPGQNAIFFDGQTLRQGIGGVGLWGNIQMETVVSQGCRPIGRPLVVTKADANVIYQLGGRPPLLVVKEILSEAPQRDKDLTQERGLLIGCVIDERKAEFKRGDFLIRNPMHFVRENGAMIINDYVRAGQTVQFHVRDSDSASEDLQQLLNGCCPRQSPRGALLFSCNGRGTRLFSQPSHDAQTVSAACGQAPLAGFFCAGEIGPIGKRNFLHGHTASIAFFKPGRFA